MVVSSLNWSVLLDPANGGPGEPPGRAEAVEAAAETTKLRYIKHGKKRAKGSVKRKEKIIPRVARK
jgi:hypothetical protein|tara:strand:- start:718 stop:915 length:198 start_codon:yes stop_codon:yes gene_type:complete